MSVAHFRGEKESLHYATARYVCQWHDARGELWPFYRAWQDDFADDRTGERALAKVVRMSPADASAAWTAWVRTL
jgi:hypothetical protein